MEIVRKIQALGLNRSDRKQGRRFFRHDLILLNGHPSQETIENLHKATSQASEEYKTHVYTKYIRIALNREEGK